MDDVMLMKNGEFFGDFEEDFQGCGWLSTFFDAFPKIIHDQGKFFVTFADEIE